MATERWILSLLSAAMMAVLAGCSSSNTFNVQNPPPPPSSKLAIELSTAPTSPLPINQTTTLVATVTDDPSNAGVDWSLTCSNTGHCGTLSTRHTASAGAVTYTPPASFPANSETVSIVALATADNNKNVLASISITAFGSNLQGTYVLQAQGVDATGSFNPYQFAGLIVLDGNGVITSGEQTVNFNDPTTGLFVSKTEPIIQSGTLGSSSYFLGPDGRGTITINPNDDAALGIETFDFVFLSSSSNPQALVSAFSNSASPIQISGTGTMDLQDAKFQTTPPPTLMPGGYAFAVSGTDFTLGVPIAIGGILDIDSSNNVITGGSVTDEVVAINGVGSPPVADSAKPSGSVSYTPGPFGGIITLALTANFPNNPVQLTFTGYIVDGSHIRLIESDTEGAGWTAGLAVAQAVSPGSFTTFSGTYVFGVQGTDLSIGDPSTLTSAGVFNADAGSGYMDTFLQAYSNPVTGTVGAQISASFNGTTAVDTKGIGRVRSAFTGFAPPAKPGFAPAFIFYLTGSGSCPADRSCPALFLANGGKNYPFLGAGIAYPQTAPLTFGGDYGFSFTQQNGGEETDGTAQFTADSTTNPPTLSGFADVSIYGGDVQSAQAFSGTFNSPASNGLFAATLENGSSDNPSSNAFISSPFAADFYIIDQDHGFFIETDLVDPNAPSGLVSFGYYACRNSVTGPATCSTTPHTERRRRAARK